MVFFDLHYGCGIVLFVSSTIGCLLPFQKKVDVTPIRPLSTGIIFGVALCHLLPDASENLNTSAITNWFMDFTHLQGAVGDDGLYDTLPVAETLMCLGIFVMLVIDQCIPCPHHQVPSDIVVSHNNSSERAGEGEPLLGSIEKGTAAKCNGNHGAISNGDHDHDRHGNAPPKTIANEKVYATEIAIAIHSVIIGFTMGVNPNTDSLIGLTIAMVFHQMFEGIALAMIAVQGNLSFRALCFMVLMFASSLPVGIGIGLTIYNATSGNDDSSGGGGLDLGTILFQGFPNAIAAGMLLHIGFELMNEDFNHHSSKFPATKLVLAFIGGCMICFLAIWA